MRLTILAFVLLLTSAIGQALAGSDNDTLIVLEYKRSAAIAAHDSAFLNEIYADDFRGVTALGFKVGKSDLMEVFGRDNPNTKFKLDELEPRVFGDTAIVTGRLTGRDAQGVITAQSLYIHVYARRNGKWQLVAGQGTVVPPERHG
jgi:ketosteroid isomerase-like protein